MDIPVNMVGITTTLSVRIGEVEKTYSTSLSCQSHKLDEIRGMLDMAWDSTCVQAGTDTINGDRKPASQSDNDQF